MRPRLANAALLTALAATVTACQTPAPTTGPNRSALPTMERVALSANACWFKSGDPAFAAYKLAPELNSFSGRPRILLVHKGSPESRPLLVVQAEGSPSHLQAFGPMMQEPVAGRITADVNRWSAGNKACS
ncbi:hypothetical protein GGE16_002222 [Rhizobium leguminosarum]|uniref:Lipoprotein n=1 Tax=Rhizobium leguminosarum TaxID=384 RepID=A0AAE2MJ61_RHILE|nr:MULTISPECIES: hypothetical protein [Rhizobium]MBB4290182.1 hypothetical protein [Rhizobium leguminosarum]MBB4296825.1 hypothetical protein [Rhizobium leguminosarum]MBB4307913.1 hypothetical protein [Rhizobium leguminosarum]MBB4415749.1 hypothetical protein [Rhizobium leguminosarum]MBB4431284.1 hypothetical protein [Rhizobium esperanzae]